ncbi:putative uncharacterized protein DDB_G0288537 [Drosophila navojoa]|uniref:putative uncharacterized protein DDB_G0288537 n=1 Tax=Drosophila navojoa TaxID=7232 RepID=UPI0011BD669B|nr:putative uncharacterized protein DDB_G0288537 [Drosophila navojoa]
MQHGQRTGEREAMLPSGWVVESFLHDAEHARRAHKSTLLCAYKNKTQRAETDTAAAGSWHQPIGALRWAAGRRVRICHFQINSTPTTTITTASDDDGKKAAAVGSLQNRSTTPQLHSVINERYSQLQQQQQQQPQQQKQQQQPQQKSLHSMHKHAHTHARTYTRYQLNRADK